MLSAKNATPSFIVRLAQEYITEPATLKSLANHYSCSASTIEKFLFIGIAKGIIDELTAAEIIRKTVAASRKPAQVCEYWERAGLIREAREVREEISFLEQYIHKIGFALERVADYLDSSERKTAKRFINRELAISNNQLTDLKRRLEKLLEKIPQELKEKYYG